MDLLKVDDVIVACCLLHNFLRHAEKNTISTSLMNPTPVATNVKRATMIRDQYANWMVNEGRRNRRLNYVNSK